MSATAVKERPILFSGPMVRAILDSRKTQTRRIMKPQPELLNGGKVFSWKAGGFSFASVVIPPDTRLLLNAQGRPGGPIKCLCPYGQPGERLWVRETWAPASEFDPSDETGAIYRASAPGGIHPAEDSTGAKWRPSIHMPRWASRITLEIVSVRVERLQEISAKDILAEGVVERSHQCPDLGKCPVSAFDQCCYPDLLSLWAAGWEKINGKDSWQQNPWVWVVEFKRLP